MAIEACRLALKYMTPVVYLSDAFLATGSEPWSIPDLGVPARHQRRRTRRTRPPTGPTSAIRTRSPGRGRSRARPGWSIASAVSKRPTSPATSATTRTTTTRCSSTARPRSPASPATSRRSRSSGPTRGELLILGWGSTYGAIRSAVERLQAAGKPVAHAHLRHLNPFPADTEDVLRRYRRVLIPEVNLGQLLMLIRARYPHRRAWATTGSAASRSRIAEIVAEAERLHGGERMTDRTAAASPPSARRTRRSSS